VTIVLLVLGLVAGHAQLLDVDDDDVITGINVRGVDGFMFAAQATRNFGSKPTKDQIRRVDNEPVVLDLMRLGRKRFHEDSLDTFPDTGNDHNSESRGFYRAAWTDVKCYHAEDKKAQIGEICAKSTPKEEGGGDTFQPLQTTKATGLSLIILALTATQAIFVRRHTNP
jgi:hypothetical protein